MHTQYYWGGYQNIEVIIVNNGSMDESLQIIKKLANEDKRIKIISQENQGPAGSRDTGLKNATGDYISFCDSDDWFEPDCLEVLYKYLKEYNADISVCRAQVPGRNEEYDRNEIQEWNHDAAIDAFLEHKLLNGVLWNKLIRKELFDGIEFDKSLWYWEDLDVVWQILKKAKKVVRFNQAKYNFFIHPDSMCAKKYSDNRGYSSLKVLNQICDDCEKTDLRSHLENAKVRRYLWLYGELRLMLKEHYKNDDYYKQIQAIMRETGLLGVKNVDGVLKKVFALLCMTNIRIAEKIIR